MSDDPTEPDPATLEQLREFGADASPFSLLQGFAQITEASALEVLAVVSGILRQPDPVSGMPVPFTWVFHQAKTQARDDGYTWRQIAVAMGEGNSGAAEARVSQRWRENQVALDRIRAEALPTKA